MSTFAVVFIGAAPAPPPAKPSLPPVLVVGVGTDDTDHAAAMVAAVAESEIRKLEDKLTVVEPFDPEGEKKRSAAFAEAKRYSAAAESLYNDLDLSTSAASAETAVSRLEQANLVVHFPDLVRARLLQIRALVGNSEEKAARAAAERLLTVNLKTEFDPKQYPPEFVAWTSQRREELRAKSEMALEVRAQIPARVYVDGLYRGVAPVEARKLAPGDHYVTLIAPGYKFRQYKARAGSSETVEMLPTEHLGQVNQLLLSIRSTGKDAARRDRAIQDMGKAAGAAQVLFVSLNRQSKTALSAVAIRIAVEDGHYLAYVEETLPSDEARLAAAAEAFSNRALATDALREGGKPVTHHGGSAFSLDLSRRSVGVISAGAGAVFIATGVVFGVLTLNQASTFRGLPQTSPDAPGVASTGHTFAAVADISYLVGLVGVGIGGYLFFTGGTHPSETSPEPTLEATEKPSTTESRSSHDKAAPPPAKPPPETPAPKPAEKVQEKPPLEKPAPEKAAEKPPEKPPEKTPPPAVKKPPDGETFDDLRDDR